MKSTYRLLLSEHWDVIAEELEGLLEIPETPFDEKKYINRNRSIELLDLRKLDHLTYKKKVLALNILMSSLGLTFEEKEKSLSLCTTEGFNSIMFNKEVVKYLKNVQAETTEIVSVEG